MRFWLALLALLGLLLTPVAASAAAPACLQPAHSAPMAMAGPNAGDAHACCPDSGAPKPAKSDHKTCETACALMCAGVVAALPAAEPALVMPQDHLQFGALPPDVARAHPPSVPDRPPRHLA